ncbi:MAG: NAD(P)H-hydrate dehydratase [Gemmatimonadetes bacterium]|nr:NAD(P)H-hydrate dehydratase [Gemmatimonadota bacterium]
MSALRLPLRPYGRAHAAAPTASESAAFDRHAIDGVGVPQPVLMENAGRSAAQVLARLFPAGSVVGVVGAGNNGGDALVLLRTLAAWGRDVRAIMVADRPAPEILLHGWTVPTRTDEELGDDSERWQAELAGAAVVVDGILGTGVRGAPRERQARAIRAVNSAAAPVLAVDIPSGVNGDTGAVPGDAVHAQVTVSFGGPKLGALLHPGRARVGRLVAVEIAFPPMEAGSASAQLVTPAWAHQRLPRRGLDTHKNAVGRLVVVAGRPGMGGAAVLATRAGLRAGAGLVQVCSSPENRTVLQAAVPEAIFVDGEADGALESALAQASAVAVGPGLGTDTWAESMLQRVLAGAAAPTVVDADALNLLAEGRGGDISEIAAGRPLLLTPHPGEMSRLLDRSAEIISADRPGTVRAAARSWGCAAILKGAPSLVAGPEGPVLVDTVGSSDLATAGMGDVLTGVCGGLMAQGMGPREAAAVGLHLTGRSAVLAGRGRALTPPDVIRWLPDALTETGDGDSELGLPFVLFDQDPAR